MCAGNGCCMKGRIVGWMGGWVRGSLGRCRVGCLWFLGGRRGEVVVVGKGWLWWWLLGCGGDEGEGLLRWRGGRGGGERAGGRSESKPCS